MSLGSQCFCRPLPWRSPPCLNKTPQNGIKGSEEAATKMDKTTIRKLRSAPPPAKTRTLSDLVLSSMPFRSRGSPAHAHHARFNRPTFKKASRARLAPRLGDGNCGNSNAFAAALALRGGNGRDAGRRQFGCCPHARRREKAPTQTTRSTQHTK